MTQKEQDTHEDQRFIEGLIEGDSDIIREIYQRNAKRIKALVVRNNGNQADAQDLFQDVLMSLHRQGKNGLRLKCPFDLFFYIACRNRWINELKKRGRARVTIRDDEGFLSEDDLYQEPFFLDREKKQQLFYNKFRELGPSCQEILGLSWTKNPQTGKFNSLQDIAGMKNLSYGYVRKKIGDCRQRLLQLIRESWDYKDL